MARFYSRLRTTEERKNLRTAVVLGVLTVLLIGGIFVFGLPTVAKFAAFLTDLRKSGEPVEVNDATPPAPPRLDSLPEATNKTSVEVSGESEPGATVILVLNGESREVLADSQGSFRLTFELNDGKNTLSASAKDASGNESQKTDEFTLTFDDEEPSLNITSPSEGASFFGSKQRQIVIEGTTEAEASLTINDRFVLVEEDGSFAFATTLSDAENTFNLKSQDKAGNQTEKSLKVNFSP
jgi:hypothetical protein